MKRSIALMLAMIMIISLFMVPGFAAEKTRVIIHYQRPDANYEDWNLWLWPESGEGDAYDFNYEDDFGKVAVIDLNTAADRIGFIVREGEWKSKDVDADRFMDVTDGLVEIWVTSKVEAFSYEPPEGYEKFDAKDANLLPGAEPADIVLAGESTKVKVHYHRFDGNYEGWNLWIWPEGKDGTAYPFTGEDEFGAVADITVPNTADVSRLGLIVRLNEWEAKDVDKDRYVNVASVNSDGVLEVFLVQTLEPIQYTADQVDLSPKFLDTIAVKADTLRLTTTVPFKAESMKNSLKVVASDGTILKPLVVGAGDAEYSQSATVKLDGMMDLSMSYTIKMEGYADKKVDISSLFSTETFEEQFGYTGNDLGATYSKENTVFKLWAPTANKVTLNLFTKGDTVESYDNITMTKKDFGIWEAKVSGDLDGTYYTYSVDHGNGVSEAVDPYAKAVGVNGNRGMVIDFEKTNPEGWATDQGPRLGNPNNAVVYELHVRDLSTHESSGIKNVGKFLGLTETGTVSPDGLSTGLDHMKELGITHVQILPMYDYNSVDETALENNIFNWGYDPNNYNAVEGSYSTDPYNGHTRVIELKQTVKTLHDNNIGVIMDVVYNHTALSADSNLSKIVPGYYYRMIGSNYSNGSGTGNETASERVMVRKLFVDSLVHWVKEYHIDGFRFDLMGLHDLETMRMIRSELEKLNPDIILYGEGWTGGTSPLPEKERAMKKFAYLIPGVGVFNDDMRDGIKGHVFEAAQAGMVNGRPALEESVKLGIVGAIDHDGINFGNINYSTAPYALEPWQSINYVSAHDNLTLYDKFKVTNPDYSEEDYARMQKMSNAIVLTSQGVPFLHAGVEFMRSKDGDHNSYKSSDEINQLDWTLKSKNYDVFEYYMGLIELRKAHPALSLDTADEVREHLTFFGGDHPLLQLPAKMMVGFLLNNNAGGDEAAAIIVLHNANAKDQVVQLPEGQWSVIADGDSAGTEVLYEVTGEVTVKHQTSMVLISDKAVDLTVHDEEPAANEEPEVKEEPKDISVMVYLTLFVVGTLVIGLFLKNRKK